jgi:hypothetical protein
VTAVSYEPGQQITGGLLYRRLPPDANHYDEEKQRPTRAAFRMSKGADHLSMSLSPEILAGYDAYGLYAIEVERLVAERLTVVYDPSPAEGPHHVAVRGVLTDGVRHRLAQGTRLIKPPIMRGAPNP